MTEPTSTPLVSIIVPVFNGEKYLRESLDSIVGQTYSNKVNIRRLLGSSAVQRWRLLILYFILQILFRIPRIPLLADLFHHRRHNKTYPA